MGEWMYRSTFSWTRTSRMLLVSFTPLQFYPRGKSPRYPLDRRLGEPQSRSGRRGENSWRYRDSNCEGLQQSQWWRSECSHSRSNMVGTISVQCEKQSEERKTGCPVGQLCRSGCLKRRCSSSLLPLFTHHTMIIWAYEEIFWWWSHNRLI
jgi:hypothetical protein